MDSNTAIKKLESASRVIGVHLHRCEELERERRSGGGELPVGRAAGRERAVKRIFY